MSTNQKALQQLPTRSNVKVLSQAENGDLYLKVFLLGKGKNGNGWSIDDSTFDENVKTAVGKPLVIYQDTGLEPDRIRKTPYGTTIGTWYRNKGQYNHPPWDEHSKEHSLEMLKPFTVGEIKNIAKNQQTGDYWSLVKITDDGLKRIFKENPTLPFYVSPQLWRLNMNEDKVLKTWELNHLAIVSKPAFGVRATVQGSCSGDAESCTSHFMNASLNLPRDASGAPTGCGFCTYKAMKEVAAQTIENENNAGRTINNSINQDTSHLTNSSNFKTEERLSDNTQNAVNTGVPNATTFSENVGADGARVNTDSNTQVNPQRISVEHRTYPQPETTTYRPNANTNNTNDDNNNGAKPVDNKLALIARLEQEKAKRNEALQQLKVLARDNQKLARDAQKYETELSEVKDYMKAQQEAARENGIAEVIYNANLSELVPDEKKEELIKFSISKRLEPKEVAQLITPLYEAFDSYIASQRQNGNPTQEQVPQFNTPHNYPTTANASLGQRRESRLNLAKTPREANAFNASQNHGSTSTTSELAFIRARKLTGIYTPADNTTVFGEVTQ